MENADNGAYLLSAAYYPEHISGVLHVRLYS